ncbi:MAG: hypothetical protein M0006_08185 [Magnetospirillum sp.]|nr:hypothetical protein [Magnetospirillum sp.]
MADRPDIINLGTPLDRLCKELLARAMSPRRSSGTRAMAVVIPIPTAAASLIGKVLERSPEIAGRTAGVIFGNAVVWFFLLGVVKVTNPELLWTGRRILAAIGRLLLTVAGQ